MSVRSSGEWQRLANDRHWQAKFYALIGGIGAPSGVAVWVVTQQWPFLMLAGFMTLYLIPAGLYFSAHRICLRGRDSAERIERIVADVDAAASQRLRARLEAFSRDCVTHGDMTPAAARMLTRILEEEK